MIRDDGKRHTATNNQGLVSSTLYGLKIALRSVGWVRGTYQLHTSQTAEEGRRDFALLWGGARAPPLAPLSALALASLGQLHRGASAAAAAAAGGDVVSGIDPASGLSLHSHATAAASGGGGGGGGSGGGGTVSASAPSSAAAAAAAAPLAPELGVLFGAAQASAAAAAAMAAGGNAGDGADPTARRRRGCRRLASVPGVGTAGTEVAASEALSLIMRSEFYK